MAKPPDGYVYRFPNIVHLPALLAFIAADRPSCPFLTSALGYRGPNSRWMRGSSRLNTFIAKAVNTNADVALLTDTSQAR
jgi:hypothetical protein